MTNFNETDVHATPLLQSFSILHATATKVTPVRTKINIRTHLLAKFGFVYGVAVYAVPQKDGFTLTLWKENSETQPGGKMLRVGLDGHKLSLMVNLAKNFATTGIIAGDFLIAKFSCGIIEARKLPTAQKYYFVKSRNLAPYLRLCGKWLCDSGFLPHSTATVSVTDGCITFRAWGDMTENYSDFVKFARKNKCQIIQPRKNYYITIMDISGYILSRAGFGAGDILGVCYEPGIINLFKPGLNLQHLQQARL